ncbi:MAG: monovalent cation/H+ antiporter complex subunit F [Methanoregula sp.]
MLIDTWLFAAGCLFFLAFCAVLRIIPGPSWLDRLVAINVAITIACSGFIALAFAWGNLMILGIAIVFAVIGFSGTIGSAYFHGSEQP